MKITIAPDYARYPVISVQERIMLQHLSDARFQHVTRFLYARADYERAVHGYADEQTLKTYLGKCETELAVIAQIDQAVIDFYWLHGGMFLS